MGLFFKDDDNEVEVEYTGSELFHLTNSDSDYGYDAKIEAAGDGSFDYYETESDWQDHSHTHIDKDGKTTYDRPEGHNHPWHHRQKD